VAKTFRRSRLGLGQARRHCRSSFTPGGQNGTPCASNRQQSGGTAIDCFPHPQSQSLVAAASAGLPILLAQTFQASMA
jgi:hypothetical protein